MKRILACCLVSISILQSSALAIEYGIENNQEEKTYTQTFGDVPTNHWAFKYVEDLVERNVLNGYPDGNFYPTETVTREAFATILTVAAGVSLTDTTSTYFVDVPTTLWSSTYINAARNYITAYNIGGALYFKPTESAVREDMAVAIVKLKGYDTSSADLGIIQTMFSDYNQISESAKPYVAIAVEKGIISGFTDGTFRSQSTLSRAEAAAMLWIAFQYGNDDKVVVDDLDLNDDVYEELVETESEIEEVEEEFKPYVETLSSYSTSSKITTYDTDGNFYAVENNAIVKYTPTGSKSTLLDGNTLSFSIDETVLNSYSDNNTIYFDEVTISDILYNHGDSTFYYATLTKDSTDSYAMTQVFKLNNSSPIVSHKYNKSINATYQQGVAYYSNSNYSSSSFYLINTESLLGISSTRLIGWYEYDSTSNSLNKFSYDFSNPTYDYFNGDMYAISYQYTTPAVRKYSYSNATWNQITIIEPNIGTVLAVHSYNNTLYLSTTQSLYQLTPNGERYNATEVVNYNSVEVLDRTSFRYFSDFIFDNDGNIIFKDTTNNRIRKLTIQE